MVEAEGVRSHNLTFLGIRLIRVMAPPQDFTDDQKVMREVVFGGWRAHFARAG
jgi:hypothetical protein